jgi:hypothetical protein
MKFFTVGELNEILSGWGIEICVGWGNEICVEDSFRLGIRMRIC